MVDVTLKRPQNKSQGLSFWYQSISHRLSIVTFALGRTVLPQYIPYRQTDNIRRQTQHCSKSATVSTVG